MKFSVKHLLFVAFLIFPVAAFAQGSGSSEPKKNPKENNFAVTRSVSGVIQSNSTNSVVIQSKSGKNITLGVTKNTRISRGCLRRGKNVRATYTPNDRRATAISCK